MQAMILSIELWALKVGLKINGPKTEFMVSGFVDPLALPPKFHLSSGLELKMVLDFKYLETWLLINQYERFQAKACCSVVGRYI